MVLGLTILLGIDVALAVIAVVAMRHSWQGTSEGVPILWALLFTMAAVSLHGVGVYALGYLEFSETGMHAPQITAGMSVAGGIVPALLYGWMLMGAVAALFTGGHREPAPVSRDRLNRALALEEQGDIDGALMACRAVADAFPGYAVPLLEEARILDVSGRHEEAANTCRHIMRTYRKGGEEWVAAASRLELLLRDHLGDREAANSLGREIKEQQPKRTAGRKRGAKSSGRPAPKPFEDEPNEVALERYRQRYRDDPGNARPLFGAVGLLERMGRVDECVDMLRFIMQTFEKDKSVWSDAAYRLGLLLEHQIGDVAAAAKTYREIIRKRPDTQRRRLAHDRLAALEHGDAPPSDPE